MKKYILFLLVFVSVCVQGMEDVPRESLSGIDEIIVYPMRDKEEVGHVSDVKNLLQKLREHNLENQKELKSFWQTLDNILQHGNTKEIDEANNIVKDLLESGKIKVDTIFEKFEHEKNLYKPEVDKTLLLLYVKNLFRAFSYKENIFGMIKYLVEKEAAIGKQDIEGPISTVLNYNIERDFTPISDREKETKELEQLFKILEFFVINGVDFLYDIAEESRTRLSWYPCKGSDGIGFLESVLKFQDVQDKEKLLIDALKEREKKLSILTYIDFFNPTRKARLFLSLMLRDIIKKINESEKIDFKQMPLYKLYKLVKDGQVELPVTEFEKTVRSIEEIIKEIFKDIGIDLSEINFENTSFDEFLRYLLGQIKAKKIEDRQFTRVDKAYDKLVKYLYEREREQIARKLLLKEKEELEANEDDKDDESMGKIRFKNGRETKFPKILF